MTLIVKSIQIQQTAILTQQRTLHMLILLIHRHGDIFTVPVPGNNKHSNSQIMCKTFPNSVLSNWRSAAQIRPEITYNQTRKIIYFFIIYYIFLFSLF
jgi:hypothetical protein